MAPRKKHRSTPRKQPKVLAFSKSRLHRRWWLLLCLALAIVGLAAWSRRPMEKEKAPTAASKSGIPSLEELVAMTPGQLENVDIALLNLRCAEGLPGSGELDIPN